MQLHASFKERKTATPKASGSYKFKKAKEFGGGGRQLNPFLQWLYSKLTFPKLGFHHRGKYTGNLLLTSQHVEEPRNTTACPEYFGPESK